MKTSNGKAVYSSFPIFKRELVEALYVLSLLYIASGVRVNVFMRQGIRSSPKWFMSPWGLCNI